jgi:hypothetical protein
VDPGTKIYAHLGFSVPISFGYLIDIKMHLHELLGQHDHKDTICTQFGPRRFGKEIRAFRGFRSHFSQDIRLTPKQF